MNNGYDQNFAQNFGEFIREGRLARNISQLELAESLGLSQPFYSRLEKGLRCIDLELAVKICSALELDLNDFLQKRG